MVRWNMTRLDLRIQQKEPNMKALTSKQALIWGTVFALVGLVAVVQTHNRGARAEDAVVGSHAPSKDLPGPRGAYELITPQNSMLVLIDHQPQMAFGVQSIDRQTLLNNVTGL